MPRFTISLTPEEAATLERERARLGQRTEAAVIRLWIAQAASYYVRVGAEYEDELRQPTSSVARTPSGDASPTSAVTDLPEAGIGQKRAVQPAEAPRAAIEGGAGATASPSPKPAGPARVAKARIRTMRQRPRPRGSRNFPG